jgi:hypothetical protein
MNVYLYDKNDSAYFESERVPTTLNLFCKIIIFKLAKNGIGNSNKYAS